MAIDEKMIQRINELANLKKERELTEAESIEQKELRQEYINSFKNNMKLVLNNIEVIDNVLIDDLHIDIVCERLDGVQGIKSIEEHEESVKVTYVCKEIDEDGIKQKVKKK